MNDATTCPQADAGQRLRVGRALDNDIVVPDRRVSRYHLEVHRLGDVWTVRDLGSGNGTELNGKSVQDAEARVGDVLRVGSTFLSLTETGVELADAATPRVTSPTRVAGGEPGLVPGPTTRSGGLGSSPAAGQAPREPAVHTQFWAAPGGHGGDGRPTPKRKRSGLKTAGGIAGVVLALSVGAGMATAVVAADGPTAVRDARSDDAGSDEPSDDPSDVQERNDAAAERDRQRETSELTAETWSDRSVAPDLESEAFDVWNGLTLDERDLACHAYYSEGPAIVRLALTSSGHPDTVVVELLGLMDRELCIPVEYEYQYEYEYEVVPPVPSIPSPGGALPPPPPPAWSGPNYSPTIPSTPPSISSDNFGW